MDRFSWDDVKNELNLVSHGISFEEVLPLFFKPCVYVDSTWRAGRERRTVAIGEVDGAIVVVAFTQRNRRIRIISARKATDSERRRYRRLKHRWRVHFNE